MGWLVGGLVGWWVGWSAVYTSKLSHEVLHNFFFYTLGTTRVFVVITVVTDQWQPFEIIQGVRTFLLAARVGWLVAIASIQLASPVARLASVCSGQNHIT